MISDYYTPLTAVIKYDDNTTERVRRPHKFSPTKDDVLHIITEADTLTNLAYSYYNDPKAWVVLADVNGIMDPFDLTIGDTLVIPPIYLLNGGN